MKRLKNSGLFPQLIPNKQFKFVILQLIAVMIFQSIIIANAKETESKEKLTSRELVALRDTKKIRVVLSENYDKAKSFRIPQLYRIVEQMFGTVDITVVGQDARDFDATVKLEIKGTRYSKKGVYVDIVDASGSIIEGKISISVLRDEHILRLLKGKAPSIGLGLPGYTSLPYPKGSDREYMGAFYESGFIQSLAETISSIWGQSVSIILSAVLQEQLSWWRVVAVRALGRTKEPDAILPLIAALEDKDWNVRRDAAKALGSTMDPRVVEPLIFHLKDQHPFVRNSVAYALGTIKDRRAVEPLIISLKDSNSFVRVSAAHSLGELKDSRAVVPLVDALKDKDYVVREEAAEALGKIQDVRAVEPLIVTLQDQNKSVRNCAVKSLGKIKDTRAIEPLIGLLNDDDSARSAWRSLRNITGKDFNQDQSEWQKWWDRNKYN